MNDAMLAPNYSGDIFHVWETYRRVVEADFMAHRAVADEVEAALCEGFPGRACTLLDLGCGDAGVFAPVLERVTPARYRGVDLSGTALRLAAENLAGVACPVELAENDILSELARKTRYDVIHSSFVLHHLATPDKGEFFRRAARRLAPGGVLLLTDTVREEGEGIEAYLDHYCGWIEADWRGLTRAGKDAIYDHIRSSDRPDPLSTLDGLAKDARLRRLDGNGKHGWHRLMRYVAA